GERRHNRTQGMKVPAFRLLSGIALLVALLSAGCGADNTPVPTPAPTSPPAPPTATPAPAPPTDTVVPASPTEPPTPAPTITVVPPGSFVNPVLRMDF